MEDFYRTQRRRFGYLMDGDEPAGGVWNLDQENREPLPRGPHVWPEPAQDRLRTRSHVLARERGQGVLGLGPDGFRHARRHEVHHGDRRPMPVGERVRDPQRELRVGAAADRDEDPADVLRPALLDDGDVARRVADGLVDRGRDDGRAGIAGAARTCRPSRRS